MYEVENPNEKIIQQTDDEGVVTWSIYDDFTGYWRTASHISSDTAWSRPAAGRKRFESRQLAQRELESIWDFRRARMPGYVAAALG